MNTINVIKERIERVIKQEEELTERELEKWTRKKHDEESYWGCGGNYRRYEKLEDSRKAHLQELKALRKGFGSVRTTEALTLYPWYCPDCQLTVYLSDSTSRNHNEIVDCPICNRTLYRAAKRVNWEVITGSRRADT